MKHRVPHDLDTPLAKKATNAALQAYAERFSEYSPKVHWKNDTCAEVSFQAKGITLKGLFELGPGCVEMDMEVPLLLRAFRKRAIEVIDAEIREWVGRAKTGELDDA